MMFVDFVCLWLSFEDSALSLHTDVLLTQLNLLLDVVFLRAVYARPILPLSHGAPIRDVYKSLKLAG